MALEGIQFPLEGIQFPLAGEGDGAKRSSVIAAKAILAAAIATSDPAAAEAVLGEKQWQGNYQKHIIRSLQISQESPERTLALARAGLKHCYDTMEYHHQNGRTMPLGEACYSDSVNKDCYTLGQSVHSHDAHSARPVTPPPGARAACVLARPVGANVAHRKTERTNRTRGTDKSTPLQAP